ncbi:uncharacterized protein BT62DRAFT_928510 [Guyanagaster necrorhizus]|uniref:Uncharacterized protein n=1 Tax=Guyanagaster necrorhizus TaxID=856835 RepID=A0A9P7VY92_9AGAR|nr:uncharacterized protein BT62DRAFT_928510 [Guyanagaster necrorhizus MCA 3950]KAG7449776.1 hypothetical protein BT62DRAFT_928510 [Guyanagaster necrorhizus MCA 3950]
MFTVVLHGLTTNKHGSAAPLILKRSTAPSLEITYLDNPEYLELEDVPLCLPSGLPLPDVHTLTLNIDGYIAEGRVGTIYRVTVDALASSAAESFHILPLVVKICICVPERTSGVLNEAAFCDEMEVLQGFCVPRHYGLFQTNYDLYELEIPILLDRKKRDSEEFRRERGDLTETTTKPLSNHLRRPSHCHPYGKHR